MKKTNYKRRYRFPLANFRTGFSSAFDVRGALAVRHADLYRHERTPAEVDALALAADWAIVGLDIQTAIERVEQETSQK